MSDNDFDPKVKEALDEHIRWVNQATEPAISEGATGVQKAIAALTDEQLRGMPFVMVTARAGDTERMRETIRDQVAREQFDGLGGPPSVN